MQHFSLHNRSTSRAAVLVGCLGLCACGSESADNDSAASDAGLGNQPGSGSPDPARESAAATAALAAWCAQGENSARMHPDDALFLPTEEACGVRCASQAAAQCANEPSEEQCLTACVTTAESCARERMLTLQCAATCGSVECAEDGVSEITGCDDYAKAVLDCILSR